MGHNGGGAAVLVVSDTHFSPRTDEALENWSAVVRYAEQRQPVLVVHAGDLTLDGAHDPTEFSMARRLLDELPAPWVAVPGNHDIGDNPGSSESIVTEDRLERWRSVIGTDHWRLEVGAWTLLGLNAQLFGAGLDAADAQWDWLSEEMAANSPERPIVLVLHKPLTASDDELGASPVYRFVPAPARYRLQAMFDDRSVPLVISGHVHQFRSLHDGRRHHLWAPTTWAVLPEHAQTTLGQKRSGVLLLSLGDDGTSRAEPIQPEGLAQLTLTEDIPDPYHL